VYAIIKSGGKQYRVAEGQLLRVERDVLDSPQVGAPVISGASVLATVLRESRGEKIIVFKKKRRKNHTKRKHGHRQDLVEVRIDSINL
jgi:large subunit ribosomal protein L21